jgi:hypothetical protein
MRQHVTQAPMIAPPAPYTVDDRSDQSRSTKVGQIQFSAGVDNGGWRGVDQH